MSKQISEERQAAYYIGNALIAIGVIVFLSGFISLAGQFGNHDYASADASGKIIVSCWIGGFIILIIGSVIRNIGAQGAAGSGLVLDPEQAREDLEPYARQVGGMVKDALDEADVNLGARAPATVVKVKCRACQALNDEDARFCKQCGQQL